MSKGKMPQQQAVRRGDTGQRWTRLHEAIQWMCRFDEVLPDCNAIRKKLVDLRTPMAEVEKALDQLEGEARRVEKKVQQIRLGGVIEREKKQVTLETSSSRDDLQGKEQPVPDVHQILIQVEGWEEGVRATGEWTSKSGEAEVVLEIWNCYLKTCPAEILAGGMFWANFDGLVRLMQEEVNHE